MIRYFSLFMLLLLCHYKINAQSRADDVSIEFLDTNREEYFYGEPVSIQLEIKNHSPNPKYIHRVNTGVTISYYLIEDKIYVDTIGDSQRNLKKYRYERERLSGITPDKPFLLGNGSFVVTASLSTQLYGSGLPVYMEGVKYKNTLTDQLTTIPEGNYYLVAEFFLIPGQKKIRAEYPFKVLPLPEKEKEAYQKYLEATVYATNSWAFGDRNYRSDSPESYETFILNYPESVFVEYALFNLAESVYYYRLPTRTKEERVAFYESFLRKDFQKSNLVGRKAHVISSYLEFTEKTDKRQALNEMLTQLKDFAPVLSEQLIGRIRERNNIRGLENRTNKNK